MDAMSQRRSARALLGAPRATLRATTSYLTSIIRCPYYGEDLASVTPILPTTPTSLIAANKRDYLPDACFYTGTHLRRQQSICNRLYTADGHSDGSITVGVCHVRVRV